MPRGRKPEGEQALSNAERQARYRARHLAQPAPVATRPRRPADRRSRPQRWRDAVSELLAIQAAYADWLAALPDGLHGSSIAEVLEAIVELDLTDLAEIELPAATAAINNANEKNGCQSALSGRIASGGVTIRTRLLDRGCGVMTSPKPAHETIPNWPPSNWNGGRDQIGIGGRLRWNPHKPLSLACGRRWRLMTCWSSDATVRWVLNMQREELLPP